MRFQFTGIFAILFCAYAFGGGIVPAHAAIQVKGLSDKDNLQTYIETVVEQRKDKDDAIERLEPDIDRALKAKGYYDAVIEVESDGDNTIFKIAPGPAYSIHSITFEGVKEGDDLIISEGDVLDAEQVLRAQQNLFDRIEEDSCYYNLDVAHEIFLNTDKKTADIRFIVHGQEGARFGVTEINGGDNIDRSYLYEFLNYNEGDCWKEDKLEETKAALYATGLLASADTDLPDTLPEDGSVPVTFNVKERAFRSIKLGAGYNTSEGAGISAEWEHRNIFHAGEKLSFQARLYEIVQTLGATFNKPFFLRDDQNLQLETSFNRENNDAYKEISYNAGGAIQRQFTDDISASLGAGYELSRIEDEEGRRNYGLFSVPGSFTFDNRDNILDPHKGWRLSVNTTPFFDTLGEADPFWKTRLTASTYFDLSDSSYDPVFAIRGSIGSIQGADASNVPATKRFYAGGGGSIRGFGYQDVGPREVDGDPAGGLSVIEMTGEMRFKVTNDIGAVAFVDAGQVYEESSPEFGTDLAIGAGVGARYYTSFGPIRFDVATPLNRKDQADGNYQIYLSIGQAF